MNNGTGKKKERATFIRSDRTRGVHLSMVIIMTLFFFGIAGTAVSLKWELWVIPLCGLFTLVSWIMHISRISTDKRRMYFYMFSLWTLLVYHGVHDTSFFDLASLAAIEFTLLALTNERRLLNIGFILFWFCFFWTGGKLLFSGQMELDSLVVARIIGNLGVVITTFVVAGHIIRKRDLERAEDDRLIGELAETREHAGDFLENVIEIFRSPVKEVKDISADIATRGVDERTREDALRISRAGSSVSDSLDDLRDIVALESGRIEIADDAYMISGVIDEVLKELKLHEYDPGKHVIVDVDADIPLVLKGDAAYIKKILRHLMDNAIKYTDEGAVYVRVGSVKEDYGINLCFDVRDTGRGMNEDILAAVRKDVYEGASARRDKRKGLGLGLRLVYGLTHAMDGFVHIDTALGGGTRVNVSIPQKAASDERCMEIDDREGMKIAFYQHGAKYDIPAIRDLYTSFVMNVIKGFELKLDLTSSLVDLKDLLNGGGYTDLFIAEEEYLEDKEYFESLGSEMNVLLVAGINFEIPPSSCVRVLRKPLYTFPLVRALSGYYGDEDSVPAISFPGAARDDISSYEEETSYEPPVTMSPGDTGIDDIPDEVNRGILVSCDSASDLPPDWYDRWGIDVIRHTLHTENGSFVDGSEINCDELMYFMGEKSGRARSSVPDKNVFMEFFSERLGRYDDIIHISIAKDSSPVYNEAVAAAADLRRVSVIDSGSMSGGTGLLVLYAAHLVRQSDLPAPEIVRRIERVRSQITARFVLDNTSFLLRGNRMSPLMSRLLDAFLMHPAINMKDNRMKFSFVWSAAYRPVFIRSVLLGRRNIDTSLLFITHASLSGDELGLIKNEVEKYVKFDRVYILSCSGAIAVNVGPGTFGLMFHTLSHDKETGGRLFDFLPGHVNEKENNR